jgi:hypothetical protein
MTGYDFHPEADLDLDEIWEFIANNSRRFDGKGKSYGCARDEERY